MVLILSMAVMVFINLQILNFLFLIFLFLILIVIIRSWKMMVNWEKLIVLTFSFYSLLSLDFGVLRFLKLTSLLDLIHIMVPFGGLKNTQRVYLIILPFLVIIATLGAEQLLKTFKPQKKIVLIFCSGLIVFFMLLENIPFPLPIQKSRIMKPLSNYNLRVYKELPFKQNRIVLEIPFNFKLIARNSIYLLNWKFHQNYLLNGKTSIKSPRYIINLKALIGVNQKKFPTDFILKTLIEKYSVNYVIFHWDLLSRYQNNPHVRSEMLKKIKLTKNYSQIEYDSKEATILKIQENFPLKSIKRCYSLAHLKKNRLKTSLKASYSGEVEIYFNDYMIECRALNTDVFIVDFFNQKLDISGNKIELKFEKPVFLKDIQFID